MTSPFHADLKCSLEPTNHNFLKSKFWSRTTHLLWLRTVTVSLAKSSFCSQLVYLTIRRKKSFDQKMLILFIRNSYRKKCSRSSSSRAGSHSGATDGGDGFFLVAVVGVVEAERYENGSSVI